MPGTLTAGTTSVLNGNIPNFKGRKTNDTQQIDRFMELNTYRVMWL